MTLAPIEGRATRTVFVDQWDQLQIDKQRLREERDRLYRHTRHLVNIIVGMNKNEQACDAAAYLTQITPPEAK